MNFKEIKELLELSEKSSLTHVEVKDKDFQIIIKKEKETMLVEPRHRISSVSEIIENNPVDTNKGNEPKEQKPSNLKVIKAPMVGTFYGAPSPDADAFVKVGDKVSLGDTVCILEAMKLMNEIESEYEGTIVSILVENEQMVEYGQPLFEIQ